MEAHTLPPASSIKRWLFTTNHKDIGILYLVTAIYFLLVGGALSLLFRLQLANPSLNVLPPQAYNQAITIHGLMMVLFVVSPLAFALANYVVPLQIGARDLAFPRLNALSYWLYLFAGILVVISFFQERTLDVGWTLYQPLAAGFTPYVGVNTGGLGLALLTASVTVSTINFVVTIFMSRAQGVRLTALPMFTMTILLTVLMMLYAFPALLAGIIMLASDRILGTVYFTSNQGGAILWDHIFWFFGHPEVYIVLFPALGVMADILVTFSRRPLFGRRYILAAMVIVAALSFLVWGHHMFLTGIHPDVRRAFTVTTIAISLPFDAIILSFIYTLSKSKIHLRTPMLFTLGSIAIFIIGGITGVFLGSIALDYVLRGTYFVVAHFHYTMAGGALVGLIAGIYYWYPKMTGRMFSETLGRIHFVLAVTGFNLLYFPMFLAWEMPRRVPVYAEHLAPLNQLATLGGFIFGGSFLVMFWNLLYSLRHGEPAGDNPWNAPTLEWLTRSPPPPHNFDGTPALVDGRFTFLAANGAGHHAHETHLSPWPFMLSLASMVVLLGLTTHIAISLGGLVLLAASVLGFARERFVSYEPPLGERWPFERVDRMKLAWWTFLASEIVLFGVLLSAYIYVRSATPSWPAPGTLFDIWHGAVNTFILLTSSFTLVLAIAASRMGSRAGTLGFLGATMALGVAFLLNKYGEWAELFSHGVNFSTSIVSTSFFLTTGIHGAHVTAGLVALAYLISRALKGAYAREGHETLEYFGYYWHFVDIVWVFIFPLFYLL
jgi:cytochrome c oxidase subunit I+III